MRFLHFVVASGFSWALAASAAVTADAGSGTGIGIQLGSPSGLSLKLPMGRGKAVHAALGYDLGGPNNGVGVDNGDHLYVGADYAFYNYSLFPVRKGRLPLYYGPGAYVVVADRSAVGIRGVVGIEYQFAGAPFDAFLELGPRINVVPNTQGDVFAGLGGRFFF